MALYVFGSEIKFHLSPKKRKRPKCAEKKKMCEMSDVTFKLGPHQSLILHRGTCTAPFMVFCVTYALKLHAIF